MAHDTTLAGQIREKLSDQPTLAEKQMFGSLCFMLRGKMLICVQADGLLCRVGSERTEAALTRPGTRPMIHGGRIMKGYVYIETGQVEGDAGLDHWLKQCLDYNTELTA